jgi:enoyl-CoA hydratase/carnithine racemase
MIKSEPLILVEKVGSNSNIALITLNRQDKLNALSDELLYQLEKAFRSLKKDSDVRVVIIYSEGKSWSVGVDLRWISALGIRFMKAIRLGQRIFDKIEKHPTPVIAAINGYTFGGGMELALSCDIRIAADTANFGQTETTIGIPPGWGGTFRLPRVVGLSTAKYLIFSGRRFTAEESFEYGLVSKVVPGDKLRSEAIQLAEEIARNAPIAVKKAKKITRIIPYNYNFYSYWVERRAIRRCFVTRDIKEGIKAVFEKRKPEFEGK